MKKLSSAFISYSSDAKTRAQQIVGCLRPLKVDTYEFSEDMGFGGDVPKQVEDAIEAREALILVLSAQSRRSEWVALEIGLARGKRKRIIVYKTAHNLELPPWVGKNYIHVLNRLDDLDDHFADPDA